MYKKFSTKIHYLSIVFGLLLALGCSFYFFYMKNKKSFSVEISSFTTETIQKLEQQEAALWQKLNLIGITQKECEKIEKISANTLDCNEKSSGKSLSEKTFKVIFSVLKDLGIDPNTIRILSTNDHAAASALETVLFINEQLLNELSQPAQKFVIAHELFHIINKDALRTYSLSKLAGKDPQELFRTIDNPVSEYFRFQEQRADTQAASINKDYAQGYVDLMHYLIAINLNSIAIYPKNEDRLKVAQDILASYEKSQPQQIGLLYA
jgi:hypothetical protein